MYCDYHTHSLCSPDGTASMADMARAAARAGLAELCFTDHFDLLDMSGQVCLEYDWAPVRAALEEARRAAGSSLTIRKGVELGGAPTDFQAAGRALSEPLDFVIASVHNLSLEAGAADFYDFRYTGDPALCRRHLDNSVDSLQRTAEWGSFDVIGHIPYLLRYMRDRDGVALTLGGHWDRVETLLRTVIAHGRGIEVNTTRGRTVEDMRDILKLYRSLGGEIVTVGSDAHRPQDVGRGIPEACALLEACGFRYLCTFRDRKPRFLPLS